MEIKQLRYFSVVARLQNMNRAAEVLNLAQSALSRHIQSLEADLGIALFARHGRTIRLSRDGALFLEKACQVLDAADDAILFARSLSSGNEGRLQIGFRQVVGRQMIIPQAFKEFRRENPDAQLELTAISTYRQIAAIERAEIDAGFVYVYEGIPATLTLRPVLREHWVLAVPENHRLSSVEHVVMKDLVDEPFLTVKTARSPILQSQMVMAMIRAGFEPNIVQEVEEGTLMLDLVSVGMGIGFILGGEHQPAGVVFRRVDDFPLTHDLCLCWDPKRETPLLNNFVNVVTRFAQPEVEGAVHA